MKDNFSREAVDQIQAMTRLHEVVKLYLLLQFNPDMRSEKYDEAALLQRMKILSDQVDTQLLLIAL